MFLLRRALGLGPRRPPERDDRTLDLDELPRDPTTDVGDEDTQETPRDDRRR